MLDKIINNENPFTQNSKNAATSPTSRHNCSKSCNQTKPIIWKRRYPPNYYIHEIGRYGTLSTTVKSKIYIQNDMADKLFQSHKM